MLELLLATAAVIAVLTISYFLGRARKREGIAWLEAQPANVARIYLRAAAEIDAYWLHAEMNNGKKRRIAAPWELEDTLGRLELVGLRLSAQDQAAVDAMRAHGSVHARDARRQTGKAEMQGAAA